MSREADFSSTSITKVTLDDVWSVALQDSGFKCCKPTPGQGFAMRLRATLLVWVRGGTSSKSEDGRREKILERLQEFQETVFPRYWYGKGGLQGYLCIDKEPSARNSAGCEGVSQEFLGCTVPGECLELGTEHVSFLPAMHQISRLISFFLSLLFFI